MDGTFYINGTQPADAFRPRILPLRQRAEVINAWLTNTEAPGYFNEGGFIQGGTAPSDEYLPLVDRIALLAPYNPSMIASLEINFQ